MNSFFKHLSVTRRSINGLISQIQHRPSCNQIRRRGLCQSPQNITDDDDSWKTFTSSSRREAAGLIRCSANHVPLSPISFLERAAKVFGDRTSVVYGHSLSYTWSETRRRCVKLASSLVHQLDVSPGDVVATLAPNIPAMQELHFAVPMAGAVLCTLNTRHDSAMISVLLQHSQAKVLFVDYHLLHVVKGAIDLITRALKTPPNLVIIHEPEDVPSSTSTFDYERLLANGNDKFDIKWPNTEWDPISLNYTSGTTSQPKGVVYNHRGAYLNAIGTFLIHGMNSFPVYLWTVPMFHCNAWCLVWGLAALGGTNVCLRRVNPKDIFENISLNKVTHMGGAPTVLNMMINTPDTDQKPLPHKVVIMTGGASPPPQTLTKIEELGFTVSHLYGLTETYGPATSCLWKPEWDSSPKDEKYKLKSRQGVQHLCMEDVDVKDSVTMESVAADGKKIGEVMFRGNTVMSGYLNDLEATKDAFRGGWFHTGDLGVKHPDGYIEIKDRQKDIIISGGENISSLEVETVLLRHPAILEAAVVGRPDNHWGQTPCAFVKLKEGFEVKSEEIIEFCREQLPHYMAPRSIVFEELPRTSTGKVQKFILREKAKALGSLF